MCTHTFLVSYGDKFCVSCFDYFITQVYFSFSDLLSVKLDLKLVIILLSIWKSNQYILETMTMALFYSNVPVTSEDIDGLANCISEYTGFCMDNSIPTKGVCCDEYSNLADNFGSGRRDAGKTAGSHGPCLSSPPQTSGQA